MWTLLSRDLILFVTVFLSVSESVKWLRTSSKLVKNMSKFFDKKDVTMTMKSYYEYCRRPISLENIHLPKLKVVVNIFDSWTFEFNNFGKLLTLLPRPGGDTYHNPKCDLQYMKNMLLNSITLPMLVDGKRVDLQVEFHIPEEAHYFSENYKTGLSGFDVILEFGFRYFRQLFGGIATTLIWPARWSLFRMLSFTTCEHSSPRFTNVTRLVMPHFCNELKNPVEVEKMRSLFPSLCHFPAPASSTKRAMDMERAQKGKRMRI